MNPSALKAVREENRKHRRARHVEEIKRLLEEYHGLNCPVVPFPFEPAPVLISAGSSDDDRPESLEGYDFDYDLFVLIIRPFVIDKKSLQPGSEFYDWEAVTLKGGIYMDVQGNFFEALVTGNGRYMMFPNGSPGDADVELVIEYSESRRSWDELTLKELAEVRMDMRWFVATAKDRLENSKRHLKKT